MKKILIMSLALMVLLVSVACNSSSGATSSAASTASTASADSAASTASTETTTPPADVIVLRLAEVHAEGYPTTLADREFARLVNERTNGRIEIQVYSGGQLGDEKDCVEQVQFGGIDFTRVSASPVAEFSKGINAIMLPYLYRDADHMWAVLNGPVGQKLLDDMSSANIVGLCWYDSGARSFYTSKPMTKFEDIAGMKFRMQDNQMMMAIVSALGANPISMPLAEVYGALQTGVVDGGDNNFPTYESLSHYEVAPYYLIDAHSRVPEILVGSQISLSKLSEEDQKIIKDAAKETQEFQIAAWAAQEEKSLEVVKSNPNVTITEVSPEELVKFQEAMAPIYEEFGKGYEDIIQQIQDTK